MLKSRAWFAVVVLAAHLFARQPADAQTIAPELRADIDTLMQLTNASALTTQMVNLVTSQMLDQLKSSRPGIPERAIAIARQVLGEELTRALAGPDSLVPRIVAIYANRFTHDDVKGLLNFYRSDLGKKLIAEMPMLLQEGAAAGQEWMAVNIGRIATVLETRLKAEGFIK
jgi:uncharacterized protein